MSMRSEQRRLKQLEVEYEQRLEDLQALKMTEVHILVAYRSVAADNLVNSNRTRRYCAPFSLSNSSFMIWTVSRGLIL